MHAISTRRHPPHQPPPTTANRQWTETGAGRSVPGAGTMRDLRDVVAKDARPTIGHEIGQWMFWPDSREIKKWTGVMALKNFEMVRDDLKKKCMLDLEPQFVRAAGRFATLLYKEEIEILRRTPGYAGFSLLDLHDHPTPGTALIGPLDAFWNSKGFITPEACRKFCGPILDDAPATFRSLVQIVDNFARNHKLGNLFEARVGKGSLLVCTMDLPRIAARQPQADQLLKAIYSYVGSPAFPPAQALEPVLLDKLLSPQQSNTLRKLGAKIHADSAAPGHEAALAIDGDPDTHWHSQWEPSPAPMPHELTMDIPQDVNESTDEAAVHTPETVAAFRDAVSKGFPGARVTWAFSWLALHDERPNYAAIRTRVAGYHNTYGDEITFIPGGYFAPMYSSRAQVNLEIRWFMNTDFRQAQASSFGRRSRQRIVRSKCRTHSAALNSPAGMRTIPERTPGILRGLPTAICTRPGLMDKFMA